MKIFGCQSDNCLEGGTEAVDMVPPGQVQYTEESTEPARVLVACHFGNAE